MTVMLPGVITPVPFANTAVKLELDPVVIVAGLAPKLVIIAGGFTVTVAICVIAVPVAGGVTVSVYVVVDAGLTLTAVPLVTAIFPGVIIPVPLTNTAVRLELPPAVIVPGLAPKLEIVGAGFTVIVVICVIAAPLVGVTVSVYWVVDVGLTVTGIPLVTGRFPGVITPVPFTKTPVNVALVPSVTVVGLAVKLVIDGRTGGGGVGAPDEPPQPISPPKHRLSVAAYAAGARIRFKVFPGYRKVRRIYSDP